MSLFANVTGDSVTSGSSDNRSKAKKLKSGESVTFRLLPNMHDNNSRYYKLQLCPFPSPRPQDNFQWTRPAIPGFKADPQINAVFDLYAKARNAGSVSENESIKKLAAKIKAKDRAIFSVVTLNGTEVELYDFSQGVADTLFGAKGRDGKPDTVGLYETEKAKGKDLFDTSKTNNWITVTLTPDSASGIGKYEVTLAKTKSTDADGEEITKIFNAPMPEFVSKISDVSQVPNPAELSSVGAWSLEEVQAFVDSEFKKLPSRFTRSAETSAEKTEGASHPVKAAETIKAARPVVKVATPTESNDDLDALFPK